eukprot:274881-Prymnesium_polylepis.1
MHLGEFAAGFLMALMLQARPREALSRDGARRVSVPVPTRADDEERGGKLGGTAMLWAWCTRLERCSNRGLQPWQRGVCFVTLVL